MAGGVVRCAGGAGVKRLANGAVASCFCCCEAVVYMVGEELGPGCSFSNKSYLSVSVTSTAVGTGSAAFNAMVAWLNAYWVANPTFTIGWNTHQGNGNRCSGQYGDVAINGYWARQIGTLNGYPVWAYNAGLDTGHWALGFLNGDQPGGAVGPNAGASVGIILEDAGDGTCEGGAGDEAGSPPITGAIDFVLTVENNGCEDGGI